MRAFWSLTLIALSAAAWGEQGRIADCSSIESDLERLICYDERAGDDRRQREREAEAPVEAGKPAPAVDEPAVDEQAVAGAVPVVAEDEPVRAEPARGVDDFGVQRPKAVPKQVDSRIQSIRRAPLGHHVMTLSNGQIWAENEPGVRRIKAGQDVTIAKRRLRYVMHLESGRNVAVHRIEDK